MRAVPFPGQNRNYVKQGCFDLPAYEGEGRVLSVWVPSEEELKQLLCGAHIILQIQGKGQPPVGIQVCANVDQAGTPLPPFEPAPIPMVLHCPKCNAQHVDKPEPDKGWDNPPHRTHLCHGCGIKWRPANVSTTGVEKL